MIFDKKRNAYELRWLKKKMAINRLGGKCSFCGEQNVLLLDFHHDLDNKEHLVSRLLSLRWDRIEAEIKKCILLCSNCHREYHCNNNNIHNAYKNDLLDTLNRSKCEKCGYRGKNLGSLSFHHVEKEDKNFIISDAINGNISLSIQEIYNEISKCKILCSNCHRLEHFDQNRFNSISNIVKSEETRAIRKMCKPVDKNLVLKMFNDGMRQIDIAKNLKCAKSTICGILKNKI